MFEFLTFNFSGAVRTETFNGRKFTVAKGTLIVPGVLNGSSGALYYDAKDVEKSADRWNGMPITYNHIRNDQGEYVYARKNPKLLAKYQLGTVYNTEFVNNKLDTELWFDDELTNRIDPRLLPKIRAGKKQELSTGLGTTNTPTANGNFNGTPYTHRASDYNPDHVAILTNEVGACSVRDGCGVNNSLGGSMNRDEIINFLVVNCSCQASQLANVDDATLAAVQQPIKILNGIVEAFNTRCDTKFTANNFSSELDKFLDENVVNAERVIEAEKLIENRRQKVIARLLGTNNSPELRESLEAMDIQTLNTMLQVQKLTPDSTTPKRRSNDFSANGAIPKHGSKRRTQTNNSTEDLGEPLVPGMNRTKQTAAAK
jgi:hypothetical protein